MVEHGPPHHDAAVHIGRGDVPHSLIADREVHGLPQAGALPFANFRPEPWWGDVWMSS